MTNRKSTARILLAAVILGSAAPARLQEKPLPLRGYGVTVTLTDPNATNSPATISVRLEIKAEGTDAVPFGEFDDPADGAVINTATATVSGWALDDVGMKSAKIYRKVTETKKALVGTAKFVVGARPDIETAYAVYPQNHRAGWSTTLNMAKLPNKGVGTFVLTAYIYDLAGHEVLLGSHTITGVAPAGGAAVPFGSLDAPENGSTVSGNACAVSGWAPAPPPRAIAEKGGQAARIDGRQREAALSSLCAYRRRTAAVAHRLLF